MMELHVEPFVAAEIAYRREQALRAQQHRDALALARAGRGTTRRWSLRRR